MNSKIAARASAWVANRHRPRQLPASASKRGSPRPRIVRSADGSNRRQDPGLAKAPAEGDQGSLGGFRLLSHHLDRGGAAWGAREVGGRRRLAATDASTRTTNRVASRSIGRDSGTRSRRVPE